MKRNLTIGLLVMATVAVAVPFSIRPFVDTRLVYGLKELHRMADQVKKPSAEESEAELQEQLRLARLEGLPTSVAEFEATLLKIKPEDNAAPIYRQLMKLKPSWDKDPAIAREFIWDSTKENPEKDRETLERLKEALALIDAATSKPKCLFDRDWNQGILIIQPEFVHMKAAVKPLFIRARLSAAEGNHSSALKDCLAIFRIGHHARGQHDILSDLVGEAVRTLGMNALGTLAMRYPAQTLYRQAIDNAVREWEVFPRKSAYRYSLVEVLATIEICSTKEGRATVGIKEQDVLLLGEIMEKAQPPVLAKARIVRAMRKRWAAFDAPASKQKDLMQEAEHEFYKALVTFPIAAKTYESFGAGFDEFLDAPLVSECRQVAWKAFLRAVELPTIPTTIKTDDLLSPFDKKPVTYKYEKGRIVIEVSAPPAGEGSVRIAIGPRDPVEVERERRNYEATYKALSK